MTEDQIGFLKALKTELAHADGVFSDELYERVIDRHYDNLAPTLKLPKGGDKNDECLTLVDADADAAIATLFEMMRRGLGGGHRKVVGLYEEPSLNVDGNATYLALIDRITGERGLLQLVTVAIAHLEGNVPIPDKPLA